MTRGRPKKTIEEKNNIADLRQTIEDTTVEDQKDQKINESSSIEMDSLKNIISHLISFPYDKTSELAHFEHYKLSESEKEINSILAEIIILEYIPRIDIGKVALWCFIFFNGLLITEKIIVHKVYMKQAEDAEGKVGKEEKREKPRTND